jgi:hypothetical protein
MLVGAATGLVAGVLSMILVDAAVRPDVAIALVVGVPSSLGLLIVLSSNRRWVTTFGAFVLAIGSGWFGLLAVVQAVNGA